MAKTPLNSTAPRLTIVVVVFNSATVIDDCLASITPGLPIIVVDNGSTDATVEHVRRVRPDAQIIENGLNLGYGIANNVGLAHVDTEFGMILNPDAIVIDSTSLSIEEVVTQIVTLLKKEIGTGVFQQN